MSSGAKASLDAALNFRLRRCASCVWSDEATPGQLTCREGPPQVTIFLMQRPNLTGGNDHVPQVVAAQPSVNPEQWCSRWEAKGGDAITRRN